MLWAACIVGGLLGLRRAWMLPCHHCARGIAPQSARPDRNALNPPCCLGTCMVGLLAALGEVCANATACPTVPPVPESRWLLHLGHRLLPLARAHVDGAPVDPPPWCTASRWRPHAAPVTSWWPSPFQGTCHMIMGRMRCGRLSHMLMPPGLCACLCGVAWTARLDGCASRHVHGPCGSRRHT